MSCPRPPMEERASEPIPDIISSSVKNVFMFGPLKLSVAERLLKRGDEALPIGGRALDLLTVLVERAGEIISHKKLIARAWPDVTVEEANLRVHIAVLGKMLGDGLDGARYISNVAGRGYCFVAVVARSAAERGLPLADRTGVASRTPNLPNENDRQGPDRPPTADQTHDASFRHHCWSGGNRKDNSRSRTRGNRGLPRRRLLRRPGCLSRFAASPNRGRVGARLRGAGRRSIAWPAWFSWRQKSSSRARQLRARRRHGGAIG
jgi:DNA-binding winged helix-turn-helix (wHTH) protein